jgi:NADH dehydrogenase
MILIVGASGRLGGVVVELLLAQGKPVRAMNRTPARLAYLKQQGAEVVSGDLRNPASLLSACQGVEQVLAAAHALDGKGDNNPQTVDDAGNRQLIDAAKAAGVKHFIFVSVQGASPDAPLEFFRIKYRAEEYLRASGLSFTILRPSAYMDLWAQLIGQPILEQGKTTIFGRGNNPINFVAVEDVARFVSIALDDPCTHNRVIEVGGPENLTLNQVAEIFERTSGRQAKKRHVPLPSMHVMSVLMQPLNPALSRLIRLGIFMDTANLRYDMAETSRTFGIQLTTMEEVARRAITSAGSLEVMSFEKS